MKKTHVEVEIVPALETAGPAKAKPVGSNDVPVEIWASTKFPEALRKMTRLKRLQGTKWEAARDINGWTATKFINNNLK